MKQQSPAATEDCKLREVSQGTKIIENHKRRCPRLIVFFDAFPICLAELDPGFLGISSNRVLSAGRRSAHGSAIPYSRQPTNFSLGVQGWRDDGRRPYLFSRVSASL